MKFIIATNNQGKVKEFERILKPFGIEAISQNDAGFNENPEETADTFEGNAYIKAKAVFDKAKMPVIADDSGLEVYALNNAPGVYTARYGGEGLSDKERHEKLILDMKDIPEKNRGARFFSAICLILSDEKHFTFTGTCEGKIGNAPKGENGFGYDPIFIVGNDGESLASISGEEKDKISHRGNALREMAKAFSNNEIF